MILSLIVSNDSIKNETTLRNNLFYFKVSSINFRKNRRLELGFEAHRLNDVKRWGIADEVLTEIGKISRTIITYIQFHRERLIEVEVKLNRIQVTNNKFK